MTIKTIVTCEQPGCDAHAEVGLTSRDGLMPPWMTVQVGSAAWVRHFCGYEHVRAWADSQILNQPLQNLPRDEQYRFTKDPEHWKKEKPA